MIKKKGESMKITVFTHSKSNRLQYTLEVVLKQLLGLDFQVISDLEIFRQISGPKINFGNQRQSESEIFIPTHSLLFEKGICTQNITVFRHLDLPAFFKVTYPKADLPFDVFSMIFYLISRYEEYLPTEKDEFGRFRAKESLAYKNDFLQMPVINLWAKKLGELLNSKFPEVKIKPPSYSFLPTYDIDHAWAYLHKGIIRTVGSSAKDLAKFDFGNLKTRLSVLANLRQDPYFTFNYMGDLRREFDLKPIYFFLLANWGKHDTNNSPKSFDFQNLIKEISKIYPVGIHPSFRSNFDSKHLHIEKQRLEKIAEKTVRKSRQHFLMLKFPETYRQLLKIGIREEFTMGYASEIGFRAGIANSFFWFDIEKETMTDLKIHPFQLMDVTLNQYLNLSPETVLEKVIPLIDYCKSVGGTFCTIWHNSSLTETKFWEGWRSVYEQIIKKAL